MNAPMSHGRRGGAPREPFTAFVCDDDTANAIRPIIAEIGWPAEKIHKGGQRNAVQTPSVPSSPSVLMVDLSGSGVPLKDYIALSAGSEPGTTGIHTRRGKNGKR